MSEKKGDKQSVKKEASNVNPPPPDVLPVADHLVSIKVVIADRPYRLTALSQEEECIHLAAQMLKDRMRDIRLQYGSYDKQDNLAMIALLLCVELLEKGE